MSDEISDERAEELAARFERMEPTGEPEVTPLGELYLVLDGAVIPSTPPQSYDDAVRAIRAAFLEDDDEDTA